MKEGSESVIVHKSVDIAEIDHQLYPFPGSWGSTKPYLIFFKWTQTAERNESESQTLYEEKVYENFSTMRGYTAWFHPFADSVIFVQKYCSADEAERWLQSQTSLTRVEHERFSNIKFSTAYNEPLPDSRWSAEPHVILFKLQASWSLQVLTASPMQSANFRQQCGVTIVSGEMELSCPGQCSSIANYYRHFISGEIW
jgi:hypothetical protein